MVEHGGFGRAGAPDVVVCRNRVEELGSGVAVEVFGAFLDHAEAEMDVAEQAPLVGLREQRAAVELPDPADVVQERCGDEQVAAQARMDSRGVPAERGDVDRMLEEPARIAVVTVGRCR